MSFSLFSGGFALKALQAGARRLFLFLLFVSLFLSFFAFFASATLESWSSDTDLPATLGYHESVVLNVSNGSQYVYVLGGYSGSYQSAVRRAGVSASDGSLGSWVSDQSLPATLGMHSSVVLSVSNGSQYVYVIGGAAPYTTVVRRAGVSASDGSLGAWVSDQSLPATLSYHESVVLNVSNGSQYVYVIGGFNGVYQSAVRRAGVSASDGSLGSWVSDQSLPATLGMHSSVVLNVSNGSQYVYVIGGMSTSAVRRAGVGSDGSLGAWATDTSLPANLYGHSSVVFNSSNSSQYVYVLGGYDSSYSDAVRRAGVGSDGSLGAWATDTSLPVTRRYASAVVSSTNFVYSIGGHNGSYSKGVFRSQELSLNVNFSTNVSSYGYVGQPVNASGNVFYSNGTGVSGATVNVSFPANWTLVSSGSGGYFERIYTFASGDESQTASVSATANTTDAGPTTNSTTIAVESATTYANVTNASSLNVTGVNGSSDTNFSVQLTFRNYGNARMTAANLSNSTATWFPGNASDGSALGWIIQPAMQECGTILIGQACLRTFYVIVPAGTANKTDLAEIIWLGNWTDNNGSTGQTSNNFTNISVAANNILSLNVSRLNSSLSNNASNVSTVQVSNDGNNALNVSISVVAGGGNLNSSWVSVSPSSNSSLAAGQSFDSAINISIPAAAYAGQYNGYLNVTSNEGVYSAVPINVTVLANSSWSFDYYPNFTRGFGITSTGNITTVTINNSGNLLINFTLNCTAFESRLYQNYSLNTSEFTGVHSEPCITPVNLTALPWQTTAFNVSLDAGYEEGSWIYNYTLFLYANESAASPALNSTVFYINVTDSPPQAEQFTLNSSSVEVNQSIQFNARVSDDLGVYNETFFFNVTFPNGSVLDFVQTGRTGCVAGVDGSGNSNNSFCKNATYLYSLSDTSQQGSNYSVQATFWDSNNQVNTSSVLNFTVFGSTNVSVSSNLSSSVNVSGVTNYSGSSYPVLMTLNNTGNATAYSTNITVFVNGSAPSSWSFAVANVSDFANGTGNNSVVTITIGAGSSPAYYNFSLNASWRQANGSIAFNTTNVTIGVDSNKSLNLSGYPSEYVVVAPGYNAQVNFSLNSIGNDVIDSVNFSCGGSYCVTFNVNYSQGEFLSTASGASLPNNFTVSIPGGTSSGYYIVSTTATGDSMNSNFSVTVQVPDFPGWTVTEPASRALSLSGIFGESGSDSTVNVTSIANVDMNFTFNVSGNITSFLSVNGSNSSTVAIAALQSYSVPLNWTTPNATTFYSGNLTITNGTDQTNVSISFNSYVLTLNVSYPTSSSQASNLSVGDTLFVNATVLLGGTPVTTNSSFNVSLSNSSSSAICGVVLPVATVGSVWALNCSMPELLDGRTYNLSLLLNYSTGTANVSTNVSSLNSVKYRDVSAPVIGASLLPNVSWGSGGLVQVNVTDNDQVQWVNLTVFYPNLTVLNSSNSSSENVSLNFSLSQLSAVGDYRIFVNSTDLSLNALNSLLYLEVLNTTTINDTMADAAGSAVNATVFFLRPNTTDVLVNESTNSSGGLNVVLSRRLYDVNVSSGNFSIKLRNASINSSVSSVADFDVVPDTDVSVAGAKVLLSFALEPRVVFTNATIRMNYSQVLSTLQAYGYSQEYLFLFRCGNWTFSSRTCNENFSIVSNTTNSSSNKALSGVYNASSSIYTIDVSNFSAYALVAGRAGDGVCRADLGETCVNSPSDCTCDVNATTNTTTEINTIYVSVGGGGGGVSYEPGLIEELALLREQSKALSNVSQADVDDLTSRLDELENRTKLDSETISELESALKKTKEELGISTASQNIYVELYSSETTQASVHVRNPQFSSATISIRPVGNIEGFVEFDSESMVLEPGAESDFKLVIRVPPFSRAGSYTGEIELSLDDLTASVPVQIRVLESKERLIDLKIQPLSDVVAPGRTLKTEVNIYNLGQSKRIESVLRLQLVDPASEDLLVEVNESIDVETTVSLIKALRVPEGTPDGRYVLRAIASYVSAANRPREATSVSFFTVQTSLLELRVFIFPLWFLLLVVAAVFAVGSFYFYSKKEAERKKRYLEKIDFKKLPAPGSRSGFIGKIAETKVGAYVELDRLSMHALIAGATGSGKTVAAQVLVEEALKKGVSVVVFDPTAQWTGFLRAQRNKLMLGEYGEFGMGVSEAQAFKGNIHVVKEANEEIDVRSVLKPGEITVFVLNKLKQSPQVFEGLRGVSVKDAAAQARKGEDIDVVLERLKRAQRASFARQSSGKEPSEIELFVANTVDRVFAANLEETKKLRLLLVYDEVHRLLPKFGGSGVGFNQIERAVREFRKWGVGLILISQVLTDFVGEIKANIGTEMQMRTKYEDDLERIKLKYGDETLKSIVRASVGTGMTQNSEYNQGSPYFVSFRPLLHNIVRLSDAELAKYEEYNRKIERFASLVGGLKRRGVDVFDVELELDLAREKLKKGAFNIVDIYIESVEQKMNRFKK